MPGSHDMWSGLVSIIVGVYGLLLAYRVVPRRPKDPEKMELWHRKFGKIMKISSSCIIVFGILKLLRALH